MKFFARLSLVTQFTVLLHRVANAEVVAPKPAEVPADAPADAPAKAKAAPPKSSGDKSARA